MPLEPGRPYELSIDLLVTSIVFDVGHRIRLEVAGGCFPKFDRNPNTGEWPALATTLCPAVQTVFHAGRHASHLLLPVIPAS
jgi:putative CocE/NonD family hydrolase